MAKKATAKKATSTKKSTKKASQSSKKTTKKKTTKKVAEEPLVVPQKKEITKKEKSSKKPIISTVIFIAIIALLAIVAFRFGSNLAQPTYTFNNLEIGFVETDTSVVIRAEKSGTISITQEDIDELAILFELNGYPVTHEQLVNQSIIRKILYNNAQAYVPSEEELNLRFTEQQNLLATIPGFTEEIERIGLTQEEFDVFARENLRKDMAVQGFLNNEILPNIPQETAVTASHILICHEEGTGCINDRTKEEAMLLAIEIHSQATPQNFADLAREFSEDNSAVSGGSLGTFGRGQMIEEFEDTAFNTPAGEISSIVETVFGFHIIYVQEITTMPNQERAMQVQYELFEKILEKAYE